MKSAIILMLNMFSSEVSCLQLTSFRVWGKGGQMSRRDDIEKKTEEILEPILAAKNFYLWDVEYVKEGSEMYLRAYIDKDGGISIDDCVEVSRALSDAIDADDYTGDDAYILEVSSPGLGRKLVKDKEFDRSIGKDVDIKFYKPVDGTKETSGTLKAFDKDTITISLGDEDKTYERSLIATVKLSIDF